MKTMRNLAFILAALSLTVAAHAESLLLKGAVVHTVSGETLSPGQVLIRDGRIAAVAMQINESADRTVDLSGQHLFPTLIAPYSTLGLLEIAAVRSTLDTHESGEFTPDVSSWVAVNPDSELIPVARANGIGYAQPIPLGGIVTGVSSLIALDGWTTEQLAFKKSVALQLFWPSQNLDTRPKSEVANKDNWKSLEDQAKERDRKLKAIDDFFEEAKAYAKARTGTTTTDVIPAWEAMLPWVKGELPLIIHADEVRQIKSAMAWAQKNKYRWVLAGARDAWMIADQLATNNIPVIYEHVFTLPVRDADAYDVHFSAPAKLQQAGVKVIFSEGTDRFGASALRNLPYAASHAVAFGLPEAEALKGLTLYPAQALGVGDQLGSIEVGKLASLIAVNGNILDLRANVQYMWLAGKEVPLTSRHTRLYDKYRSRPKAN